MQLSRGGSRASFCVMPRSRCRPRRSPPALRNFATGAPAERSYFARLHLTSARAAPPAARSSCGTGASTASAPLGDYHFVLQATPGAAAQVTIDTLRGPLHLTAAGEVGAGGALRLRGTAMPEPGSRDRLGPLLLALGTDRGDGAVAFEIALPRGGRA